MSQVELNIEKLFADSFFRETLSAKIRGIDTEIANLRATGKRLKSNPIYKLNDADNWSVDGLIKVYTQYFITRTDHYPMVVRSFVSSLILSAARETAVYYKSQSLKQTQI